MKIDHGKLRHFGDDPVDPVWKTLKFGVSDFARSERPAQPLAALNLRRASAGQDEPCLWDSSPSL